MTPGTVLLLAIAIGIVAALAAFATRAWERASRRRRAQRRMARATAGEQQAVALLETFGYELLGAQVATTYELLLDGAPHHVRLRADYVVARDGLAYVAEVKTGELAPRIDTIATRRQLLEYRIAFDVAGVLLVDVEAALVREVLFPRMHAKRDERAVGDGWWPWIVGIASVAAGTFVTLTWG